MLIKYILEYSNVVMNIQIAVPNIVISEEPDSSEMHVHFPRRGTIHGI